MCGIAGWGGGEGRRFDAGSLASMCDAQRRRGPDDAGIYISPDGRVGLGHRRLSIIDLSARGHQPMTNEDGTVWIVYNGEVYDFRLLRKELESLGHAFRSDTDTEVIVHAYEEWGTACVERLNGMFAFAIYDSRSERLILVRDRFGVKPLFYARASGSTVFASEIKSLFAAGVKARFQKENVVELFLYSALTGERTLFEGIRAVKPGTILTIDLKGGGLSEEAFYLPRLRVDEERYRASLDLGDKGNAEMLRGLLASSVERRLISDVPVGVLCSGGLDSSLVTAIARRSSSEVRLFNVSSKGFASMDEAAYAKAVARHIGAELIVYEVEPGDLQRGFVEATYFNDNPLSIVNSVPMFYLSVLARNHGVKVLLSGEGADEFFGGYDWRHLSLLRSLRWRRRMGFLPDGIKRLLAAAGSKNGYLFPHRFKTIEQNISVVVNFVSGNFERGEERRLDAEAYSFMPDEVEREVSGAMLSDLREYLEPLLMRQDRMTMAASVECRLPFLDYTVAEFAMSLPLGLKLRANSGKWILKKVAEEFLPREVVYRQKKGFPVPASRFLFDYMDFSIFSGGFWENYFGLTPERCRRAIEETGSRSPLWYQLLMMEVWGRIFLNNEDQESIRVKAFRERPA